MKAASLVLPEDFLGDVPEIYHEFPSDDEDDTDASDLEVDRKADRTSSGSSEGNSWP